MKKQIKKFREWMRYNPPGALSSAGWCLFEKEYREKAPVRFWLTKDLRRKVVLPIKWKFTAISDWIRFRTYDKYHVLKTGLKPDYVSVQHQILHVNFNLLKDFVEIEMAWHKYICDEEMRFNMTWCEKHMPFYRVVFPFCNPDMGVAHLEWAATLDDPALPPADQSPQQAKSAREILALYRWWIITRPSRKEIVAPPYSNQGLDDIMACFDPSFDRTAEDFVAHQDSMEDARVQSDQWDLEDDEMLIRLMKIRKELWT
jgi:hypothetical protein